MKDYIRLVWIVCGYLIIRPYIDKGFKKLLEQNTDKEESQESNEQGDGQQHQKAKMSGNALRGVTSEKSQQQKEEEEDDKAVSTSVPQWGKSARKRQEKFFQLLEREVERKKEEEDDKDIEDLLED